jgi:predicted transcriptional regulator
MTRKINNKILSIDHDDDDMVDYKSFFEFSVEDTQRKQKKLAEEVNEIGDVFLKEIDKRKLSERTRKYKYAKYIVKHNKSFDINELLTYSIQDVVEIYNTIKEDRFFRKFLKFIFGL